MANAKVEVERKYILELNGDEAYFLYLLLHDVAVLPGKSAAYLKYNGGTTESSPNSVGRMLGISIFNALDAADDGEIEMRDGFDEFFDTDS